MSTHTQDLQFSAVVILSLSLHAALLSGVIGHAHAAVKPRPPMRVSIKMAPMVQKPVEPEPATPAKEYAPAVRSAQRRKAADKVADAAAPAPVSRPIEPSAEPPEPVDFTGLTLTSPDGAASWASVTGNGQAMEGALSAPPRGLQGGSGKGGDAQGEGAGNALVVVGASSLSRAPTAPRLDEELVRNYPRSLREQGTPGRAVLRIRIMPDGRVGQTRVLSATLPEFGHACQRTVAGSRFGAPLDKRGQPVATDVSYTCEFEVTR